MENPIINQTAILKKGKEKGAWTFIELPPMDHLPKNKNATVKVRGFIDAYVLKDFHLWAMKKGVFIPIKAEIRKAIKKEEGDTVKLEIYLDEAPSVKTDDFLLCLKDEPQALARFEKMTKDKQKQVTTWIFSALTDQVNVQRIAIVLDKLAHQQDFRL